MAKSRAQFVCQQCGASSNKWQGRCEACHAWNSIVEETAGFASPLTLSKGQPLPLQPLSQAVQVPPRLPSGLSECDRVLGGGFVAGAALLLGGDPGIGKSTLLLQVAAARAQHGRVLYLSGEEAVDQIRLRAQRLRCEAPLLQLGGGTRLADIITTISSASVPELVIIDSIQTLHHDALDAAAGSVAQVRACASELVRLAKNLGFVLVLVGHVTKDGSIAGPKVIEHLVDVVLYLEGDRSHLYRILRGIKNRFGATDEIGVFSMGETGLAEVPNPSALFMPQGGQGVSGGVVLASMEGTRPLLLEIQALTVPATYGAPRRTTVGFDANRLAMMLAVLEARGGISLAQHDVYLNIAGGYRVTEPAADLAVMAAVLSAHLGTAWPTTMVMAGEVSLSGKVRPVNQMPARLREATRLGFTDALIAADHEPLPSYTPTLVDTVGDVIKLLRHQSRTALRA